MNIRYWDGRKGGVGITGARLLLIDRWRGIYILHPKVWTHLSEGVDT